MEEQRQRQEEEARRTVSATSNEPTGQPTTDGSNEEAMLEQAVAMSLATESNTATPSPAVPDFSAMTEEEQIAYAMQMSLQQTQEGSDDEAGVPMETDDKDQTKEEEEDLREVMDDPEFLQSVLRNLPGVDPQSEVVRNAVSASKDKKSSPKKDDKSKK
ncbi:26S proteasome non-ATPase regulatory subunit 4 [Trichonephila clavata]|uniref:26S proteasome non-ATPase regulatory subunit 4 n=1 Tax=Trichonephila clavata TaxID=2740835 RepID=A0A8X6HWC8_TRICU|nr:26S proteasome non-ATPase regulatory subunit 4 [Trichonephila clavata]